MKSLACGLIMFALSIPATANPPDCEKFPQLAPYMRECTVIGRQEIQKEKQQEQFDRAASQVLIEDWVKAYLQCAISFSPILDDGISDAQTVAIGLGAQCKNSSPSLNSLMPPADAEDFTLRLRPRLVEIILIQRSAAKRDKAVIKRPKSQM